MIKTKLRSISIAALGLIFALIMSFAIGSLGTLRRAEALDYRPATIFSAATGGSVGVSDGDASKFIRFTITTGGKVHFRRDLALKWFERSAPEEGSEAQRESAPRYFDLEFSFVEVNFKEFSLEFESAEESFSKENKSVNAIHLFRTEGEVTAVVQNAYEQDLEKEEWEAEPATVDVSSYVRIRIDEENCSIGEFAVYLNETPIGKFKNVGGNYMEYLSSASTTPRIPITFHADELDDGVLDIKLDMKNMNGQAFLLNDEERVVDNAKPALVLNESVYSYKLGKRWDLNYEAIDVCDDTVTVTRRYAMLKKNDEGTYLKPSKDDYKSLTTSTYFMPTSDDGDLDQYVSIYFDLDDGSDRSGLSDEEKENLYIYLNWYAVDGARETVETTSGNIECIKVNREEGYPEYFGVVKNDEEKKNEKTLDENGEEIIEKNAKEYQAAVDEASKGLSAGKGSYFYLPSLRGLIGSAYSDYRNLRFSVYYRKQSDEVGSSASSATSLRYNAIRFEIDEEGKYLFRVLATDASSNAMKYYYEGRLQDVTSSNIWDIDEIPEFSFEVGYHGVEIEDPGTQSLGYSEQNYTFSSFDIVGLTGYQTKYELYRFERDEVPSDRTVPGYDTFVASADEYFQDFRDYMTKIKEFNSDVSEDDKDRWDRTDNAYHWDPQSGLSFTPQESAYYILKLTVTESRLPGRETVSYQVIDVRNKIDPLPDPFDWLESNVASIVLFSISAVLAIVFVILLVIKPSEKKVEDVDLESLKGKNKKKKE